MAKMRVHELAKELEIKSADIITTLVEIGVEVKAASSIDDEKIEFVKKKFAKKETSDGQGKETPKTEKAEGEESSSKEDEKKEERIKPRVLITSKGIVRTGEHRSHGDGERRKRRHGEEHHRRRRSGEHHAKGEKKPVETESRETASADVLETKNTVVANEVTKEPEKPAASKVETKPAAEPKTAVEPESVKPEQPKKAVSAEPQKTTIAAPEKNNQDSRDRRPERSGQQQRPERRNSGDRTQNRDSRNNGDRTQNRDNRNNGDRTQNRDNRNNRNNNFRDRNNDRNNRGGNRNDNRNGQSRDFRNRNERGNEAAAEPLQNKDRKARENKFRQGKKDNQNRNNKNYEDGNGKKGRNGRRGDFSKPILEKPKKKEEKKEEIKIIQVPESITIGELAERMKMTASTIIKKLFLEGKMVTVNTEIDFDSAEEIAMGYEIMCEKEEKVDIIEELLREDAEDESLMVKRPPVVCVMGHVDHGKTSLLDAIRETNVISGEAGGITQHIGASVVKINGRTITFLDTPGHEAFTSMRMRGAQSTDIAILVVAADDGVMPQTVEAINHAKAADIEIIVAINKIDKPGANIDRVKQGLAEYGLLASDWGGNVEMVPVSAHTKEGIDDLLEMVLLQADVLELKANPNRQARGIVIEAKLDKGKGPVATVLVQKGTLKIASHIAAGANFGKVRAMSDDKGNQIKEAGPSTPVEILGLSGVPNAGEVFVSTETSSEAKDFANTFVEDSKAKLMESNKFRISLDDLNSQIEAGELKELNIIIKADVQGSVEAVKQSLLKLSNDEVEVKVIHGGVGAINESDVILASASNAIIIGFNVKPDNQAEETAKNENVDLRLYSVIYNAIDDIERAMKGMLEPVYEEKVIGHAEIRQIFKASGVGNIAGSYVLDGTIQRGCKARISRDGEQIFEGNLASLKRFKDDVKEVRTGYECGLVFESFNDIMEGDQVEAYMMVEVPR